MSCTVWRPRYIQKIVYTDGRPDAVKPSERLSVVSAKEAAWDEVQRGMEVVITSGTGMGTRVPGQPATEVVILA